MKLFYKVTAGLLICSLLLTGLAGCGQLSATAAEDDSAPFYEDRVVTVVLVLDSDDWEYMQQNAMDEEYVRADLWYDGELVPDVAVRTKGNSSLKAAVEIDSLRFSLKVDLNYFNSYGNLYGVKKLNFNNGFSDPTFLRETLAYEIFEEMGVPSSRTSFVDLWVNDTHLGLYTMVEQVDKTFLEEHFESNEGNLYKPELPSALLSWTEADLNQLAGDTGLPGQNIPPGGAGLGNQPQGGVVVERGDDLLAQMELKTNESDPDHSTLFRLLDVLNNEPDESFVEEIEKVLDVDEVLRFLAVSAAIVHLDNYIGLGHNYYLYEVDGKFSVIPWDLNMVFGTFNCGLDRDALINFYIDEPTSGAVADYPLVDRLLSVPAYLESYQAYLEEIIEGPFSPEVMNNRIDELAEMIRPYVEADELKFYSTEDFERALGSDIAVGPQVAGGMSLLGIKGFVTDRVISIWRQLDGELPSSSGDGSGNGGQSYFGGMGMRGMR